MPPRAERHVTVAEAATRLGISVQAAWQAVQEGRLASVSVTIPRVMVPLSAIAAYRVHRAKQRAGRGGNRGTR